MIRTLTALLLATTATVATADTLHLRNGGRIEGDLLTPDEGASARFYLVETSSSGTLKIAKVQVARVVRKSDAELNYERILPKMPDTVEGHWKMSEWCRTNGLKRHRQIHLEQVVKRSPDHEEARYGLGYSRIDGGRWVKMDEWMEQEGYVRYKGRWKLRQNVALEEAARKYELEEKDWRKNLKIWRGWIDRERRRAEGMNRIRSIENPAAAMGLAELLEEESVPQLKQIYIEVLGKMRTPRARTALIKASIVDHDVHVRSACLRELQAQEFAKHVIIPVYIRGLDPKQQPDNVKINRAGEALSWIKDESTIPHLIDALITEHKTKTGSSGGGSPISVSGNGGLSVGGKPKIIVNKVANEGVRAALRTLTEVDHGFDKEAWKRWYVRSNTPDNVNLRRSE